jgi:hypothetical protein
MMSMGVMGVSEYSEYFYDILLLVVNNVKKMIQD